MIQKKPIFLFSDRVKDDYLANRILRDGMRATRKAEKFQAEEDSILLSKSSLPLGSIMICFVIMAKSFHNINFCQRYEIIA